MIKSLRTNTMDCFWVDYHLENVDIQVLLMIVHFIVNLAAILFFSFRHFPGLYKIVIRPSAHLWYL